MDNVADYAREHRLEYYLDKPDELNATIFHLIALQDKLQLRTHSKNWLERDRPNIAFTGIRRYGYGRFDVSCIGDKKYQKEVEAAMSTSIRSFPLFDRFAFIKAMESRGVPGDTARDFADNVNIDDDTYFVERPH